MSNVERLLSGNLRVGNGGQRISAMQRNVHFYIALPMHSLKLCTVGRLVGVDSRATEGWQAGVYPLKTTWLKALIPEKRFDQAHIAALRNWLIQHLERAPFEN